MRLTRRTLLGRATSALGLGATASAAIAAGRADGAHAAARMLPGSAIGLTPMRKLVSLGGPTTNDPYNRNDYRVPRNRADLLATGTTWIKLWVSPYESFVLPEAPGLGQGPEYRPASREASDDRLADGQPATATRPAWGLRHVDEQVRAANDDGLGVVLCVDWRSPLWASFPPGDPAFALPAPDAPYGPAGEPANARFPAELDSESPWGWFVDHLCRRYRAGAPVNPVGPRADRPGETPREQPLEGNPLGAVVDAIEFCNEPNLLPWPQGPAAVAATVAMFRSAEEIAARYGTALLGPGTADVSSTTDARQTHFREFTEQVLAGLAGFSPRVWVGWSHHNYHDMAAGQADRYRAVVEALDAAAWSDPRAPVWLTEGGFDLGPTPPAVAAGEAAQATALATGWERFQALSNLREAAGGRGRVFCFAQHTLADVTDRPSSYSLRRPAGPRAAAADVPRPAYAVWRDLPGNPSAR